MLRYSLRRLLHRFSSDAEVHLTVHTIEVPQPVFPLTKHTIQLTERKYQELASIDKLHVATLVRKVQPTHTSLLDQYYPIGTYCNATLRKATH
jgi:hypothetical protein